VTVDRGVHGPPAPLAQVVHVAQAGGSLRPGAAWGGAERGDGWAGAESQIPDRDWHF